MLRLRTTAALSLLVVAGGVGMSLWMSAWPRLQDRPTEAAVAARQDGHAAHTPAGHPPHRPTGHASTLAASVSPAQAKTRESPAPIRSPSPQYPIEALRKQRGGTVLLRVSVDGAGAVTAVDVARSSGDPALDASARETMRQWRFQAPRDHQPMTFDYPLEFRIASAMPR